MCTYVDITYAYSYALLVFLQCLLNAFNYWSVRTLPLPIILHKNKRKYTYNDIGRAAFGTIGKLAVDFFVLFCNLGVSASYIVFISSNLQVTQGN